MKHLSALLLLVLSSAAFGDRYVDGYFRKDGTYVAPHYRSEPNQFRFDNYGARGNVNPYTGERGTQPNEFSPPRYFVPQYPPAHQPRRQADPWYGR